MTVPIARQPNIEPDLSDQTSISLKLFNIIFQTKNTCVQLEHSWAAIERDISILEHGEYRKRKLRNQPYLFFLVTDTFYTLTLSTFFGCLDFIF